MQKSTLKITAFALISSFLFACGGNQEPTIEEATEIEEAPQEVISQVDYLLPSPLQIAELFKNAGLSYVGDLTNSIDNVDHYNTKTEMKLNYGVYSADMAYCIMNDQTQESINYLSTLKKISEKLWMTDILNSLGLSERLESNVGNKDSLTYIMADLQMQMDDYLDENGMGYTGSIIFAGAWIETMYLGTKVNQMEQNENLVSRISEQSIILGSLISSIKQNNEDEQFTALIADLEKVNDHFAGFEDDNEESQVLSEEALNSFYDDIIALRTKIIAE